MKFIDILTETPTSKNLTPDQIDKEFSIPLEKEVKKSKLAPARFSSAGDYDSYLGTEGSIISLEREETVYCLVIEPDKVMIWEKKRKKETITKGLKKGKFNWKKVSKKKIYTDNVTNKQTVTKAFEKMVKLAGKGKF